MPPEVLVVDDEPLLLQMLGLALSGHGLAVRQAGGGRQALDLYRQHRGSIRVVLLDLTMPEFDGRQTLAALREIDPGVRCVFMTGYAAGPLPEELLALGAERVVRKPFRDLAALAGLLREVAARRPGTPRGPWGGHPVNRTGVAAAFRYRAYWTFYDSDVLDTEAPTDEQADQRLVALVSRQLERGEKSFAVPGDSVWVRLKDNESAGIACLTFVGRCDAYMLLLSGQDKAADDAMGKLFRGRFELAGWRPVHKAVRFEPPCYYLSAVKSAPLTHEGAAALWPAVRSHADAFAVAFFRSQGVAG
jgi:CheY-like chemotaxis protein